MSRPAFIPPAEAVRLTGLSADTLARYAHDGIVTAIRTPGGHRRYSRESIESLIAGAAS